MCRRNWLATADCEYVSTVLQLMATIDWCCFYHFVTNCLVALLEALCSRIFFFGFMNIGCFLTLFSPLFFVCKVFVSNKSLSSAPLNQAPVPGCPHSSCVLIVHVCLRVCASVCACENV